MDRSKNLDARRISKTYDLSIDDASCYVSDIRSRMAEAYRINTAKQVATKYNVSESSVRYAAKQFGVKKDITQTQFKRISPNLTELEQTVENEPVSFRKAGFTLRKVLPYVAAGALMLASAIGLYTLAERYSKHSKTESNNQEIIQQVQSKYSAPISGNGLEIPLVATIVSASPKPTSVAINPTNTSAVSTNSAPTNSPVSSTPLVKIDQFISVPTNSVPVRKNKIFVTPGAGYTFGNNGNAANIGAAFDYYGTTVALSLLSQDSDVGESLALSQNLTDSLELQGSVAKLGRRSAIALGLERMFNLDNSGKTKLGLGAGIFNSFNSADEGVGVYGSGTLTRKFKKGWSTGARGLVDSKGNVSGEVFLNYGNADAYNSGIAGQIVANSEEETLQEETSRSTIATTTTTTTGNNGNTTPTTIPPTTTTTQPPVNPPVVTDPIIFGPGEFEGQ